MAGIAGDAVALHHRVQAVAALIGRQRARQPDRAEHRRAEAPLDAPEFAPQKTVVKARVVGDEEPAGKARLDFVGDRLEWRRVGDHRLRDSREVLDGVRNSHARIHQRRVFLDDLAVLEQDDSRLDDPVARRMPARGFEIDAGNAACERLLSPGHRPAS